MIKHRPPMFTVIAGIVALLTVPGVLAQANLGFLEYSPTAYFTDADTKMMYAAADKVLDRKEIGASQTWKNPESGNHGKITLLKNYRKFETDCKAVKVYNEVPSRNASSTSVVNLCLDPVEKEWKILY